MKSILIAFRNLNRQKKRSFLLGGAIAFGIFIIIIIDGFTGSFVQNIGDNFSHLFAGHIFVSGIEKTESGRQVEIIHDGKVLTDAVRDSKIPVEYLTKSSGFRGTLIFQNNSVTQQVVGTDWNDSSFIRDRLVLKAGSFQNMNNPEGLIISDKVAAKLKVQVGDTVLAQLRTATGQANVGEFEIAAISYDPGFFGSISAYATIQHVNELLNIAPDEYQTLGIFLDSFQQTDPAATKLYDTLATRVSMFKREPPSSQSQNPMQAMMKQAKDESWQGTRYRLFTLNDILNSFHLPQIVAAINTAGLIILLILFVIVMVGITNTFRMIMFERTKEIGTMRALGMQRNSVRNLFLLEALFLSLGGAIAGLVVATIVMGGLHLIYWGTNTPLFLFLKEGHMTFSLSPLQVIGYIILVALLTLLAAYFPARGAARLNPAAALGATR